MIVMCLSMCKIGLADTKKQVRVYLEHADLEEGSS